MIRNSSQTSLRRKKWKLVIHVTLKSKVNFRHRWIQETICVFGTLPLPIHLFSLFPSVRQGSSSYGIKKKKKRKKYALSLAAPSLVLYGLKFKSKTYSPPSPTLPSIFIWKNREDWLVLHGSVSIPNQSLCSYQEVFLWLVRGVFILYQSLHSSW